ncbi:L,D-transpeptidase family protein [Ostreiculturibacter nitratireducens]|uniref:L,D-transpeptidase family protein n=1 Tax=Ostreiculturibacter nitratireducens TaxID=3075226 RepID=UPI0031B5C6A4
MITALTRPLSLIPVRAGILVVLLLSLTPEAAPAQVTAFKQAVAESASRNDPVSAFYRSRDYQPIWTRAEDAARRNAFFKALASVSAHGLPPSRYDAEGLRAAFAEARSERDRGRLEVLMTEAFLAYAQDVRTGILDPRRVDAGIVREVPRHDPLATLDAFSRSAPAAFLKSLPPKAPQYVQLMKAKLDIEAVIAKGGWGTRVRAKSLKPGENGAAVVELRDRLIAMGYLSRSATQSYDGAIQKAVQFFQIENGLTPDGIAGEATITEINRGPEDRLKSILVAMERLRWMNGLALGQRHIWVNLPDFTAKIVDDGKVTFETVTVVGMNQSDRRSPEFSDEMEFMVINPTWNVPRSIAVKEYLPMLKKNPNAAGHLKLVDSRGRVVNRGAVDFSQYTERTFPFSMSQPPSDGNALGLVKFMFPNPYNIYLHDTPSKSLFQREVRAFSHGCIRLGKPFDFAYALLAKQSADPVGEFKRHLDTRRESVLPLEEFVPVHIVYFTAWPTAKGRIDYRRDVYGRDGRIFEALEQAGVSLPAVQG